MTRQALAAQAKVTRKKSNGRKYALTPKQQKFVEQYLIDMNATQACIRAGYSKRNADKIGPELLGKTRVAAAIREGSQRLTAKANVTQEEVMRSWIILARSNMDNYTKWGPDGVAMKSSDELTEEQKFCVSEVTEQRGESSRNIRFKLHDKMDALNALAKHLGMFPTRVEQGVVQVPVQFNIVIRPTRGQE